MKVFALGGYGKTAIPAVELLVGSDLVTRVAIAGRNLERAEKTAAAIGDKAIAIQIDGTDKQMLASHLEEYDIMMNVAYNDTVLPAIQACILSGTHYCDVSWGSTAEQALQLNAEAIRSDTTAIVATGISPCISNLMGVYAARQLDEVEQLQIGRSDVFNFQDGSELTPRQWLMDPSASILAMKKFRSFFEWMFQRLRDNTNRSIRVYRQGYWTDVDPIKSGLEAPLSQGGTSIFYPYISVDDFFGAIPHDLAKVKPVEMSLTPFPPQLHNLLRKLAIRVREGDIDVESALNAFYDTIERDPQNWLTSADDDLPPLKLWLTAVGSKEGRAARFHCWFTPAMWDVGGYFLTSVALAVATRKILRGEVKERGVVTAEKVFDPLNFFDEVASFLPELSPDKKITGESLEWLS